MRGYGALRTGLAFLVPMAAIVAGSQLAGRLASRHGTRSLMIASLVVGGAGGALLGASLTLDGRYLTLLPGLVVVGLGQGAGYTLMFGAAAATPARQQGVASGVVSTAQTGRRGGRPGRPGRRGQRPHRWAERPGLRAATTDGLRTAVFVAAAGTGATALVAAGFTPAARRTPVTTAQLTA